MNIKNKMLLFNLKYVEKQEQKKPNLKPISVAYL